MGRQLKPARVHQIASQMLESGRLQSEPAWYRVVAAFPPATTLVRPLPVQLSEEPRRMTKKARKPSRMFQPQQIIYPEDSLRRTFFKDHPWELARPRIVLEDDGKDHTRYNWSQIKQPGKALDGESLIQHQRWLMENEGYSEQQAYDVARKEFYQLRLQEDIERRVAAEEAMAVGAQFGMSHIEIGLEMEGKVLRDWKTKATIELMLRKHRRNAAYAITSAEEDQAVTAAATATAAPEAPSVDPVGAA